MFVKFILIVVFFQAAVCSIIGRQGFKTEYKQWPEVVGKTAEEAKTLVERDFPDVQFTEVSSEIYEHTPSEGYLNKVIIGVSVDGRVSNPAKYFGYVPDFNFALDLVGKPYSEAVESLKRHLPSCKVVVKQLGTTVETCCDQDFFDHVQVQVDASGLVLELPKFFPYSKD